VEIPLNAQVECSDGICGRSVFVLMNPVIEQVTHLVVKEDSSPNSEYMVPVDKVIDATTDTIILSCSKAELEEMDPFIKTTFIEEKLPANYSVEGGYGAGMVFWPYASFSETVQMPVEDRQIPAGELAVNRGTRVEATDGYVGKVDEFAVDPQTGHITHLVMREGHLWGKKDVIIPLSAMGKTNEDTVFLKLDKHQIESLPTFSLHRRWS
jgi:sporulation protein YlmC with PRC-barrel domain